MDRAQYENSSRMERQGLTRDRLAESEDPGPLLEQEQGTHQCNEDNSAEQKRTCHDKDVAKKCARHLKKEGDVNFKASINKHILPRTPLRYGKFPNKEAIPSIAFVPSAFKIRDNSSSSQRSESEISSSSIEIWRGTRIPRGHHLEPSPTTKSSNDGSSSAASSQQSSGRENENGNPRLKFEVGIEIPETLNCSNHNAFLRHGEEGSSFPRGRTLAVLLASPDEMVSYSRSASFGSNTSTASSRSFSFPILPSEWNGSPIRMPRANEAQLRRQRLWRMRFFCCNF